MTNVLLGAETLLLALLSLLVVGLLRSHAEILRRLERQPEATIPQPFTASRRVSGSPAPDLQGRTPSGGALTVALRPGGPDTLLAFLSTTCSSCVALIDDVEQALALVPAGSRLILVTKDHDVERVRLLTAAERTCGVVMSSAAWADYAVPGSPYFVFVDGATGSVAGEGSGTAWHQVTTLIGEVHDDVDGGPRVDDQLASAGIAQGHASLYPSKTGDLP